MTFSSKRDVQHAIETGGEVTCVLEGNQMQNIAWLLRSKDYGRESEAAGLVYWLKGDLTADVIYIGPGEIAGELFEDTGFTYFSHYRMKVRTLWTWELTRYHRPGTTKR